MRTREELLKRIDLELYTIYTVSNEVTSNDSWERARALAWALEEDMANDRFLRERYEEVRKILSPDTVMAGIRKEL